MSSRSKAYRYYIAIVVCLAMFFCNFLTLSGVCKLCTCSVLQKSPFIARFEFSPIKLARNDSKYIRNHLLAGSKKSGFVRDENRE